MPEFMTFSLEDLFNEYTNPASIRETKAGPTVVTGEYTLQVQKVEGRIDEDPATGSTRKKAHLQSKILVDGQPKATTFFDISWQERRTAKGYPDRMTKLWNQAVLALYPGETTEDQAKHSAKEVLDKIAVTPIKGFVTEAFQVPDNGQGKPGWVSQYTPEQMTVYRDKGYEARNFVQAIIRPRV